jgi:hypothetical protein
MPNESLRNKRRCRKVADSKMGGSKVTGSNSCFGMNWTVRLIKRSSKWSWMTLCVGLDRKFNQKPVRIFQWEQLQISMKVLSALGDCQKSGVKFSIESRWCDLMSVIVSSGLVIEKMWGYEWDMRHHSWNPCYFFNNIELDICPV